MDQSLIEPVGFFLCVLSSALFSGSETALTALGSTGAKKLLDEDPDKNRLMTLWIDHPYRVLTAILVGNNIFNTTAAVLSARIAQHYLELGAPEIFAVGFTTFMLLTFGEITPKILANSFSTQLARTALRFIVIFYYLFWPLNVAYAWLVRSGMHVAGRDPDLEQQVTADDIEFMVNLSTKEGGLDENQERLLTSVFEYTDTTVKEVMVPRVDIVAVPDDINYTDLMETLVSAGHSRIPVYRETMDDILGMFYAKDLLQFFHKGGDPSAFDLNNYLREPVFVPTTKKVDKLLSELRERRIHIAVAVDEFGGTAGVVTLEDIIEEFFGEIQDEFDQETPLITQLKNDTYLVDARIPLDELSDEMELDFPEDEDYESLGGFITEKCGRVPEISTALNFGGFIFTVTESEPTHIVSVHIERSPSNEEKESPQPSISPEETPESSP